VLLEFGLRDVPLISSISRERELDKTRASGLLGTKGVGLGTTVVGTVAALVGHKDPLTMVRAAAELVRTRGDVVFVHFGEGPLRERVTEGIRDAGLEGRYHLMGHVDRGEEFFSVFDLFAMSSTEEGLGSSVLDAFMYGVPVASTGGGGLRELVEKRGLVCEPGDWKGLAANMGRLLGDASLARGFTSGAKDYVVNEHSMSRVCGAYTRLYSKVRGR
jgi:glycosyltransferase involved in cell wall biosynthesis